jgi:uncharacterized protein (DUF924 family)
LRVKTARDAPGQPARYIERAMTKPADIVDFWRTAGPKRWFAKNDALDAQIRDRFESEHHAAARGERDDWARTPEGALALILLFDQFPRNLFRNSAHAYATDALARNAAVAAIADGHDKAVATDLRAFFYLPFTHSEDLADQEFAVDLADALERQGGPEARGARMHRDIIVRFGRFPHRNRCLGRESTPDEIAFLEGGGFAG